MFPGDGVYQVCLIAANACGADTLCQNAIVGMVAAQEPPAAAEFKAMPNPVNDELTIEVLLPESKLASLRLVNARGQTAWHHDWMLAEGTNIRRLSVAHLPPGLYILILQTDEGRSVLKIVIV